MYLLLACSSIRLIRRGLLAFAIDVLRTYKLDTEQSLAIFLFGAAVIDERARIVRAESTTRREVGATSIDGLTIFELETNDGARSLLGLFLLRNNPSSRIAFPLVTQQASDT